MAAKFLKLGDSFCIPGRKGEVYIFIDICNDPYGKPKNVRSVPFGKLYFAYFPVDQDVTKLKY